MTVLGESDDTAAQVVVDLVAHFRLDVFLEAFRVGHEQFRRGYPHFTKESTVITEDLVEA